MFCTLNSAKLYILKFAFKNMGYRSRYGGCILNCFEFVFLKKCGCLKKLVHVAGLAAMPSTSSLFSSLLEDSMFQFLVNSWCKNNIKQFVFGVLPLFFCSQRVCFKSMFTLHVIKRGFRMPSYATENGYVFSLMIFAICSFEDIGY